MSRIEVYVSHAVPNDFPPSSKMPGYFKNSQICFLFFCSGSSVFYVLASPLSRLSLGLGAYNEAAIVNIELLPQAPYQINLTLPCYQDCFSIV